MVVDISNCCCSKCILNSTPRLHLWFKQGEAFVDKFVMFEEWGIGSEYYNNNNLNGCCFFACWCGVDNVDSVGGHEYYWRQTVGVVRWGDNGDTGRGTSLTRASSLFWRCQHHHQAEWWATTGAPSTLPLALRKKEAMHSIQNLASGITTSEKVLSWSTDLDGVTPDVVFTLQLHFSCSYLPLICLSTNQNIQLIHSLLIRIEWTTGNGILLSSLHWPIYNKLYPDNSIIRFLL